MEITPASLDAIFNSFNTSFQAGFASSQPLMSQLATDVPSSSRTNVYAWMAKLLRMREWIGERQAQNIASRSYSLTNKPFEMTVKVSRPDIVDDQLGVYTPTFREMGQQTGLWMDDLLAQALKDGDDSVKGLGWDGVPFFSASHPIDLDARETSATQSNNLNSSATISATTVDAARVALATFKGDDNRPLGTKLTHLVVPPQLEKAARDVVVAQYLANGASNTLQGAAQVLVLPQLADEATIWYAMDLSRVIKPLISQVREAPDFVQRTSPDSDPKWNRDEYEFGSQARGAAGYGLWFTAIRNY